MKNEYKFKNPGSVKILAGRVEGQQLIFDTSKENWEWSDGGEKYQIDWHSLNVHPELKEILKGFIFHRLQTVAPITVYSMDVRFIYFLSKYELVRTFPWSDQKVSELNDDILAQPGNHYYVLKALYSWALKRSITGFNKEILRKISENKPPRRKEYESIYLRQNVITPPDEFQILTFLEKNENNPVLEEFRDSVILHLAFELAPRPIQIHSISKTDFNIFRSSTESFYSINLPMAKRMRTSVPEKKFRSISSILGRKIEKLIKPDKLAYSSRPSDALFINNQGDRLSAGEISLIILSQLKHLGFGLGEGAVLLRHHLGQSLADQGASAEAIAEMLGHNSKVASRAYVGATPEISSIKTRALGKSGTYLDIMKMLITGEIIERKDTPKERWVKGLVGSQYIGGIGACGLSPATSCPKNPIYSCYTCSKFHPFIDGSHTEVKNALGNQSQYFIDIAEKGNQIESNRPLIQLEITMQAVDSVIERCQNIPNKLDHD